MLLTARIFFLLPYHHHFAGGMVAYLDHIGAAGGRVEAQWNVTVLLGGQHTSRHVIERHLVAVGAFDYNLPVAVVHLGVQRIDAIDSFSIKTYILNQKSKRS